MAPAVSQPAARIRIDRAEECLQRIEQTDDEHASAKSFEILGLEAQPQALSLSRQSKPDEEQHRIAAQREEVAYTPPVAHIVVDSVSSTILPVPVGLCR